MLIGERIRTLRKNHKLTMRQFAQIFNISESSISLYESGKRYPSHDIILSIARHFRVSIDYLYGNTEINDYMENNYTRNETQLIEMFRLLPENIQFEIRGEIKGLLKAFESLSPTENQKKQIL